MLFHIRIGPYVISICPTGDLDVFFKWANSKTNYQITFPTVEQTHIRLTVELNANWINFVNSPDLIEYKQGEAVLVRLEKPNLSGYLERNGEIWNGRLTVNVHDMKSIDFALAASLSFVSARDGFLLLHASTVIHDDNAWLFVGPSGAGKTTIAKELNGGGEPMTVDKTMLSVSEEGAVTAHATPFSDIEGVTNGAQCCSVAGIVFIEQNDFHSVETASPFEVLRLLLAQTVMVLSDKRTMSLLMEQIGKMMDSKVPFYKLKFRKDDGFWSLLTPKGTIHESGK